MILTITPNPALDVSAVADEIIANEKCYVRNEQRHPGGNAVNAAIMAKNLGSDVLTTGFLGGSSGKEYLSLLKQEGIATRFIQIKENTRTNITVSLAQSHEQTRLSFPGPRISKLEADKIFKLVSTQRCSLIVIGGSLPSGLGAGFVSKVIQVARERGIAVIVDMPGNILKSLIKKKPFLIKPNLIEFQELTGSKASTISEVLIEARKLSAYIPVQCISSVEGGALLVTRTSAVYGKIPPIKVLSTVGAGDSMVGGMAHAFEEMGIDHLDTSLELALRLGLACSAATLTNKGLVIGSLKDVRRYLKHIEIKKIVV